jgi:LEA14-like dessication related protein
MKMNRKTCFTLLLVLPAIFLWQSCTPKTPEFINVQNFKVHQLGLKESVVSADLKYYNPNSFGLQFRKAEADVFVNGVKSGRTELDSFILIPKKDTFYLPVEMLVNMKDLFPNVLDIFLNQELLIKIEGTVYLRKEGINFSVPIRYEGKQKINISAGN